MKRLSSKSDEKVVVMRVRWKLTWALYVLVSEVLAVSMERKKLPRPASLSIRKRWKRVGWWF